MLKLLARNIAALPKRVGFYIIFLVLSVVLIFQGCSGGSSKPETQNPDSQISTTDTKIQFLRLKSSTNGQSFKVRVNRTNITPDFVSQILIDKGSISSWTQVDVDNIEATITPVSSNPTGVYRLTINTSDGKSYQRNPVVLATINDRWNQPELFSSPINSSGWEDSPQTFVATDENGKETLYFAMVYLVVRFDCMKGSAPGNAGNPLCTTVAGPYQSPLRPNMSIANFISPAGFINELLPFLVPGLAIEFAPGMFLPAKTGATLYVFKFANDSYPGYLGTPLENPQSLSISNDDGLSTLSSPFIYKYGNRYSLMYNNDSFTDANSSCPGYTGDTRIDALILGNYSFDTPNISLGQYAMGPCPILTTSNSHIANGLPLADIQGNPSFYFPKNGQPIAVWDVEGASPKQGHLNMAVLAPGQSFPGGTWNLVTNNLPVLTAPPLHFGDQPEKTQPILTETEFCYRNELTIECVPFNGSDATSASSYGSAIVQMSGSSGTANLGQITAVGEPSMFSFQNQKCLSFVLAEQTGSASTNLDLQIAWVCE